jgi:uncharacterized protein (DUF2062 family)
LKYSRRLRYYYLRFIRLKGEPNELALGMAFGIFTGMMPIMPFQIALAVALAMFFKGSKITAALGTWVSNPLNWYFIYYYDYRLGAFILGVPESKVVFSRIMETIRTGQQSLATVASILEAGGTFVAAFLLGGLVLGLILAPPGYVLFLHFFRYVRAWRQKRKEAKGRRSFES